VNFDGKIIAFITAALAGSLMAVQGTFNSILGKKIGLMEGTLAVHVIGTITAAIILLIWGNGHFGKAGQVPWFAWLGGLIGVGIIVGVTISIPKLGVGAATTAIIGAQLFTAYFIDHCGFFGMEQIPFNLYKLAGMILIISGARLLMN